MAEKIYILAEILSVVICISNLFHRKVKISLYLLMLLVIDVVYISAINCNILSRTFLPMIYILIMFYALLEFRDKLMNTVLVCVIAFVITTALQMIICLPLNFLYYLVPNEYIVVSAINTVTCIVLIASRKSSIYNQLGKICEIKEIRLLVCLGIAVSIGAYYIYLIKKNNRIPLDAFITCLSLILMTLYLLWRWQKSNYENQVKEQQIEMVRMCEKSFMNLIDTVRKSQHDLNNHIMAITGMHNTFSTYSELVDAQRKYFGEINTHSKYNGILFGIKEPILAGYLFNKITEVEQNNINVEYKFAVSSNKIEYIPIFELNEIIGILLDNAREAVEEYDKDKRNIHFEIHETNNTLVICSANVSKYISRDKIIELFKKGNSTKGKNRGLGLAKIQDYQKKYDFEISVENKEIENDNWIYFTIVIYKDAR